MGIVGQQQGVPGDELGDVPADPGFGQAPLPDVLVGDAREGHNLGRDEHPRRQGHQLVIFADHLWPLRGLLHRYGGEFDDLVALVGKPGGLRVKQHQPVIPAEQTLQLGHISLSFCG